MTDSLLFKVSLYGVLPAYLIVKALLALCSSVGL